MVVKSRGRLSKVLNEINIELIINREVVLVINVLLDNEVDRIVEKVYGQTYLNVDIYVHFYSPLTNTKRKTYVNVLNHYFKSI